MVSPNGLRPNPPPNNKKPSRRKLGGSLLALGSAAVVSVYTVGYISTESSIQDLTAQIETATPAVVLSQQAAATATTVPATATTSDGNSTAVAPAAPVATATATATPVPAETASGYVDGTYTGTGTSRHGNITATVVIQNGEIASASVTNCQTRYPCSDVNSLVSAVLSTQEVPNYAVSGATDSSRAYIQAVSSALQQALAGS